MTFTEQRERYLTALKERLNPQRFKHCLGVEQTAAQLARRFGADETKARTAGLLHDIAKNQTMQEMKQTMEKHNRKLDPEMERNPGICHGPVGAVLVENEYGISDQEILNAITYHTTGRPNMGLLEKIIYLADMIEPNRVFPGVERLREIAGKDLDEALLEAMAQVIGFVVSERKWLHPISIAAYNDLLLKRRSIDAGADE